MLDRVGLNQIYEVISGHRINYNTLDTSLGFLKFSLKFGLKTELKS